jgi:tetratricopeptide (TPR) repeat protein
MIMKMKGEFKPSLDDFWPFMAVDNNLQDLFTKLMKAYLRVGNIAKANEAAAILLNNSNPSVQGQAESISLLAALGEGRIDDAQGLLAKVESEPGKLYLGACIKRAQGASFEAIQMLTDLIEKYANDLSWMPQAELLCAHLYMDMNMTNSAMNTARQVMNIYPQSDVGNDAARLHEELRLAIQQTDEAAKSKAAAEEASRAAVRARAAERAKGYGFNVNEESDAETAVDDQTDMGTSDEAMDSDQGSGEL